MATKRTPARAAPESVPWSSPEVLRAIARRLAREHGSLTMAARFAPAEPHAPRTVAMTRVLRALLVAFASDDEQAMEEMDRAAARCLKKHDGERFEDPYVRAEDVTMVRSAAAAELAEYVANALARGWRPDRFAAKFVSMATRDGSDLAACLDVVDDLDTEARRARVEAVTDAFKRAARRLIAEDLRRDSETRAEHFVRVGLVALGMNRFTAKNVFKFRDARVARVGRKTPPPSK